MIAFGANHGMHNAWRVNDITAACRAADEISIMCNVNTCATECCSEFFTYGQLIIPTSFAFKVKLCDWEILAVVDEIRQGAKRNAAC